MKPPPWQDDVRRQIDRDGFTVVAVSPGPTPTFAYSVGFGRADLGDGDLVLAGGSAYGDAQARLRLLRSAVSARTEGAGAHALLEVPGCGCFSLGRIHESWVRRMMPVATGYYECSEAGVVAWQLVPPAPLRTLDVPDMAVPWTADGTSAWRWLDPEQQWDHVVAANTLVFADLGVLRGKPVAWFNRFDETGWELFSTPPDGVGVDDVRLVPIEVVLATDGSLSTMLGLPAGTVRVRDEHGCWVPGLDFD